MAIVVGYVGHELLPGSNPPSAPGRQSLLLLFLSKGGDAARFRCCIAKPWHSDGFRSRSTKIKRANRGILPGLMSLITLIECFRSRNRLYVNNTVVFFFLLFGIINYLVDDLTSGWAAIQSLAATIISVVDFWERGRAHFSVGGSCSRWQKTWAAIRCLLLLLIDVVTAIFKQRLLLLSWLSQTALVKLEKLPVGRIHQLCALKGGAASSRRPFPMILVALSVCLEQTRRMITDILHVFDLFLGCVLPIINVIDGVLLLKPFEKRFILSCDFLRREVPLVLIQRFRCNCKTFPRWPFPPLRLVSPCRFREWVIGEPVTRGLSGSLNCDWCVCRNRWHVSFLILWEVLALSGQYASHLFK